MSTVINGRLGFWWCGFRGRNWASNCWASTSKCLYMGIFKTWIRKVIWAEFHFQARSKQGCSPICRALLTRMAKDGAFEDFQEIASSESKYLHFTYFFHLIFIFKYVQ